MKIADFTYTCLSHITVISYTSSPSNHSFPPLLQSSKHSILQLGLAECAERLNNDNNNNNNNNNNNDDKK